MENVAPPDKRSPSPVEALARETPTTLMAQLRAIWPQVEQALQAGHTLRLIHQRLNMAGIPISCQCLIVYRGRIERRKKGSTALASPNTPSPTRSLGSTPSGFDPLANLGAQEKKRVAWQ